jgi:hypothetical protein
MGHLRLGRLPKTRRWTEVINLLDTGTDDPATLADAVIRAAEHRLRQLAHDQGWATTSGCLLALPGPPGARTLPSPSQPWASMSAPTPRPFKSSPRWLTGCGQSYPVTPLVGISLRLAP